MTFTLSSQQQKVVNHRGSNLQVIACAGSGKTESISQRVASLVEDGVSPASIVAFTFTERAATELKERIYSRVADRCGDETLGLLSPMFVGTIHAYCLRMLQENVSEYGDYDILDTHQQAGLISREYKRLGLDFISDKHWAPVRDFAQITDIISNELISINSITNEPLRESYIKYCDALSGYKLLTFGQIIARAIEALDDPDIFSRVHSQLTHLIVDEYQDINPAQHQLITKLASEPVELCVVGDDDQSIYQWRGADINNIIQFTTEYPNSTDISLATNRRSRPHIVETADQFAQSIDPRLPKSMKAGRTETGSAVIPWSSETDVGEAEQIAETVQELHNSGISYNDIAILYRSVRTASGPLLDAFDDRNIPYTCAGRTGLFLQPHISALGELYAYLAGRSWQTERYGESQDPDVEHIVNELAKFSTASINTTDLKRFIVDWKSMANKTNRPVKLVEDYYRLLRELGTVELEPDNEKNLQKLGSLARFGKALADFELIARRGRMVKNNDGQEEYKAGTDRGLTYYQRLHSYLQHYARDAYEDFDGEEELTTDAVDVLTVHQSKGLEWPVVFMPSLTNGRFPSSRAGKEQDWLLGEDEFPRKLRDRYEGSDAEERRLFYVALTRARDVVYCSHFDRKIRSFTISPYLDELSDSSTPKYKILPIPEGITSGFEEHDSIAISFSELALYQECGLQFRLKQRLNFPTQIASELGYGNAVHHIMRQIAEQAKVAGKIPTDKQILSILNKSFYLPFSNASAIERLRKAAKSLVDDYIENHSDDLHRVWATERAFELQIDGGLLHGRADVILDGEGSSDALAIVDYKTPSLDYKDDIFKFQLAVYAAAARGEGLIVNVAYLHSLKDSNRDEVDVSSESVELAVEKIGTLVHGIKNGEFTPNPLPDRCKRCDVRRICKHATCNPVDLM